MIRAWFSGLLWPSRSAVLSGWRTHPWQWLRPRTNPQARAVQKDISYQWLGAPPAQAEEHRSMAERGHLAEMACALGQALYNARVPAHPVQRFKLGTALWTPDTPQPNRQPCNSVQNRQFANPAFNKVMPPARQVPQQLHRIRLRRKGKSSIHTSATGPLSPAGNRPTISIRYPFHSPKSRVISLAANGSSFQWFQQPAQLLKC